MIENFDMINDLPISEEILGAYLEGNLMGAELREVQNIIGCENRISDLVDNIENDFALCEISLDQNDLETINPLIDFDSLEGFDLPIITAIVPEALIDGSSALSDDIFLGGADSIHHHSYDEESNHIRVDDCSDNDLYTDANINDNLSL